MLCLFIAAIASVSVGSINVQLTQETQFLDNRRHMNIESGRDIIAPGGEVYGNVGQSEGEHMPVLFIFHRSVLSKPALKYYKLK